MEEEEEEPSQDEGSDSGAAECEPGGGEKWGRDPNIGGTRVGVEWGRCWDVGQMMRREVAAGAPQDVEAPAVSNEPAF